MTFLHPSPKSQHAKLAAELAKLDDHVTLHPAKKGEPHSMSGRAENSDDTVIDFRVEDDNHLRIDVVANPSNLPLAYFKDKVTTSIKKMLSAQTGE